MAWLEKRGDKWAIAWRQGRKVRRQTAYTDKKASMGMLVRLNQAQARGCENLTDPYADHRDRPLSDHVAEWLASLRQAGRAEMYIGAVKGRMERLVRECKWGKLGEISADAFTAWRETAMGDYRPNAKEKSAVEPKPMGARTKNHYLEGLRSFCLWAVKWGRMEASPVAHVEKVDASEDIRRARRAVSEEEIRALLTVVPVAYTLLYKVALATGLRADELRALEWGDIHANATTPYIALRARTTKSKRGDFLPLRADVAADLSKARGEAGDADRVFARVPRAREHVKWLAAAGIPYVDEQGRRFDIHALRHEYGTLLSKAGVAPREAMALMRHTDMRLTMNVYTDPRIFDLSAAVEKLPTLTADAPDSQKQIATGTDANAPLPAGAADGEKSRVAIRVAPKATLGHCMALTGTHGGDGKPQDSAGKMRESRSNSRIYITAGDGIRTHDQTPDSPANSHDSQAKGSAQGSAPAAALPQDPDFRILVDAWPGLPAALKAGIVAMVKAAQVEDKQ